MEACNEVVFDSRTSIVPLTRTNSSPENSQDSNAVAVSVLSNLSPEQTTVVLTKKDKPNSKQIKTEEYLAKFESTKEKECSLPLFLELNFNSEDPRLFFKEIKTRIRTLKESIRNERNSIDVLNKLDTLPEILRTLMAGIISIDGQVFESTGLEELIPLLEICSDNKFPVPLKELQAIVDFKILPITGHEVDRLKENLKVLEWTSTSWEKSVAGKISKFKKAADVITNFLDRHNSDVSAKEYRECRSALEYTTKEFGNVLQKTLNSINENRFFDVRYAQKVCEKIKVLIDFISSKYQVSNDQSALTEHIHENNNLHIYFPFFIKGCFLEPVLKVLSENSKMENALSLTTCIETLNLISKNWDGIESFTAIEAERQDLREEMRQSMLQNQSASVALWDDLLVNNKNPDYQKFSKSIVGGGGVLIQNFINSRSIFNAMSEENRQIISLAMYREMIQYQNPQEIKIIELLQLVANKKGLKPPLSYPGATSSNTVSQPPIINLEGENSNVSSGENKLINLRKDFLSIENGSSSSNNSNEHTVCKEITLFIMAVALLVVGIAISRFDPES